MGRNLQGGVVLWVMIAFGLGFGSRCESALGVEVGLQQILDSSDLKGLKTEKVTQVEFQILSGSEGSYQVSVKYQAHPAFSISKAYPLQTLDLNDAIEMSLSDLGQSQLTFRGDVQSESSRLPSILIHRIAKFLRNEDPVRAGQEAQIRVIKPLAETSEYEVQLDYQIHDKFYYGIVATREEAGRPAPRSYRGASVVEALSKAFSLDWLSMQTRINRICGGKPRRAALAWVLSAQSRLGYSKEFQDFFIDGVMTKRTLEERSGDAQNLLFQGADGLSGACEMLKRAKRDDSGQRSSEGCSIQ